MQQVGEIKPECSLLPAPHLLCFWPGGKEIIMKMCSKEPSAHSSKLSDYFLNEALHELTFSLFLFIYFTVNIFIFQVGCAVNHSST